MYAHKEEMRKNGHVCIVCGKIFDPSTPTVTCSPECERKFRQINQRKSDFKRGRRKTPIEQTYNSGLPKSGITGVTYRRNGKWQAAYKKHYIGVFDTIEDANNALEQYKRESAAKDI